MPIPIGIKGTKNCGYPVHRKTEKWKDQSRLQSARNCPTSNEHRTECDGCIPSVIPYNLHSRDNDVQMMGMSVYGRGGCAGCDNSTNFCSSSANSSEEILHTNEYLHDIQCRKKRVERLPPFLLKPPISPKPDFQLYFTSKKIRPKTKCSKTGAASKSDDSLTAHDKSSILFPDIEVIRIPSTSRKLEAERPKPRRTCSEERVSFQEEWLRPKFTNTSLDPAYTDQLASYNALDENTFAPSHSGHRNERQLTPCEERTACDERLNKYNRLDYRNTNYRSEEKCGLSELKPSPEFCDDRLFLLSILPSLKKMDHCSKINAKVEMLNTLQKAAASPLRHQIQHSSPVSPPPLQSRLPDKSLFTGLQNLKKSYKELCTRLQRLQ